tara:strand:+ start:1299 stop:2591 length:1293 start_codon:yes stop_codon:yes gene_type:complete
MAISRFQMNRQLRAYGGMMGDDGRKAYGIGSFFQEKIMDPVKKVFKSDAAKAAAAIGGGFLLDKYGIPGTGTGPDDRFGKGIFSNIFKGIGGGSTTDTERVIMNPKEVEEGAEPIYQNFPKKGDSILKTIGKGLTTSIPGTDKSIAGLLMTPQALALGSGLLAGAFTKDEDDPAFTGQDVGLNLQDIRKLANITDPKTGAAIGLNFLPDVAARKFTPTEMAASFAGNVPQDFTENRTPAQAGGIMGDQKDFEEFLQDMKDRDMGMMQDRILRDFENYMKRKRMIDKMPEAKDGGIMKAKPKMAGYGYDDAMSDTFDMYNDMKKNGLIPPTMTFDEFLQEVVPEMSKKKGIERTMAAEGGMMDMGGMEMDLRGGGFVPMGAKEKADDVPARLSKNEFVFTADAVRAAGGGNVDKGADKMYATMKKLENKVA